MTQAPNHTSTRPYHVVAGADGAIGIQFVGRIGHLQAARLIKNLRTEINSRRPKKVTADLNRITYFDDFGVLVLMELRNYLSRENIPFSIIQPPPKVGEVLSLTNFDDPDTCGLIAPKPRDNFVLRLGHNAIEEAYNIRFLVSFLGSAAMCMARVFVQPRLLRGNETISLMQKTGVDAVPIVGLISFLMGLIMAFVSSLQLQQFGASIYVANLVALAMVSELGPIMTAIVVAGRSGSAFAAEIGTMRISDEIDALFTMGISPTQFLVVPRIVAAMVVVPLLTLFADIFAILGGMLISLAMLDLTVVTYITQTMKSLSLFEFGWGLMKSVVFAGLVAWIGCLRGFQVRGGASEVGNAATSAVVSGIFLIILFDSIFAVIRSYW
jgi:phospholipid/cholesterol/gamma-HCH transport system permease protein